MQLAVLGGNQAGSPRHGPGGHQYPAAPGKLDGALFETPGAQLGSTQVHEDGHMAAQSGGGLPYQGHGPTMVIMAAMGQVEADHIDAGTQQLLHHGR